MTTLTDKQTEVDMFIREKDALRRLKLEKSISGGMVTPYAVISFLTIIIAINAFTFFGVLNHLDNRTGWGIAVVVAAIAILVHCERMVTIRRVQALKEYMELRLKEEREVRGQVS